MNSYVVALQTGGIQESPDIVYKEYQVIRANTKQQAIEVYNTENYCSYYYGSVMCGIEDGNFEVYNKELTFRQANEYSELLTKEKS